MGAGGEAGIHTTPDTVVESMLGSRERWILISSYVESVLQVKEEEERNKEIDR